MKAFYVFMSGGIILIIAGLVGSLMGDKGYFMLWMTNERTTIADYYFYYVTMVGEAYGFIAFGILLWFISWKRMLTIPVLGAIVMITSFALKQFFRHERPTLYLDRIHWEGPTNVLGYHMVTGLTSFPSGHSMAAWALFTLMAAHVRKTWFSIFCLWMAVSVSVSRIYLMVHFLQDVVAGAMIGIALGFGVYYGYKKWTIKNPDKEIFNHKIGGKSNA